jgi:hypothetical protein
MANRQHLAKLNEGVGPWNRWRTRHPEIPDLRGASLRRRDLSGADLSFANLEGSDLSGADLSRASLRSANLAGASLRRARLWQADLGRADLAHSHFGRAVIGYTAFGGNDLSQVQGLGSVLHAGPSTIGIDTIYRSRGNVPKSFLHRAGIPKDFIKNMDSLSLSAVRYPSCFISHSTKDSNFATRLYRKLRGRSVRCWFAPEDLKIGDEFQKKIEESILRYDKLLLVISKNSIKSSWVEWEVKRALKRENRQGRTVLFPIRLDNSINQVPFDWAAKVRKRQIGDFRRWQEIYGFRSSFERLLSHLAATSTPEAKEVSRTRTRRKGAAGA